jgi:hypothetical protein
VCEGDDGDAGSFGVERVTFRWKAPVLAGERLGRGATFLFLVGLPDGAGSAGGGVLAFRDDGGLGM